MELQQEGRNNQGTVRLRPETNGGDGVGAR